MSLNPPQCYHPLSGHCLPAVAASTRFAGSPKLLAIAASGAVQAYFDNSIATAPKFDVTLRERQTPPSALQLVPAGAAPLYRCSLGLPKRLPLPEVADHLVCSVCGAKNTDNHHPIWARPDVRVPGVIGRYPDFTDRKA